MVAEEQDAKDARVLGFIDGGSDREDPFLVRNELREREREG